LNGDGVGRLSPSQMREAQQQVVGLLASIVHRSPAGTRIMLEGWDEQTTIVLATLAIGLANGVHGGDLEGWLTELGGNVAGIRGES